LEFYSDDDEEEEAEVNRNDDDEGDDKLRPSLNPKDTQSVWIDRKKLDMRGVRPPSTTLY
jgi:hypothetical protein